ncbi:hypothetical protein NKI54_33820 [Mesorhizobium sp. M0663]|uniref:hypothetical protein n=1 Tax=Mesorhizobium sp. M0663 TaxID=2956981 RepID=UPI0033356356
MLQVTKILVRAGGTDRIVIELAKAIDIPAGLINAPNNGFRPEAELQDEINKALTATKTNLVRQFAALLQEAERRLQVVEIRVSDEAKFLAIDAPFGTGKAFAGGSIKLRLFAENSLEQNPLQIKFGGRCEVAGTALLAIGPVTRAVAMVCIVEMNAGATVRIDVDDFNISLPEFELPSLELPSIPLKLKGDLNDLKGLAGAFQRLVKKVDAANIEASFKQDPAPGAGEEARLALRARPGQPGGIDWAVVLHDFVDGDWVDGQIEAKLAKFKATVKQVGGTTVATFDAIRVARTATKMIIDGNIAVNAPLQVKDNKSRLGPLEVSWEGLAVAPSVSTGDKSLWVDVSFHRLLVRVHDDPTAFLAFSGKLKLSPKGVQVTELHLVEPYPIELIANTAAAVAREAAPVVKVIFNLVASAAKQTEEIIIILGKMAAAVAQAAVLVAGEIIDSVADLVTKTLSGIAELIAAALKALAKLGKDTPNFIVEIRIATDPIELRQVLITLPPVAEPAPATRKKIAGGVLGVQVEIENGWQPGLLIDFVSQPGAYLTLTHDVSAPGSKLTAATISTDLWLKREEAGASTTTPIRDADKQKGDRAEKPLLGVSLNLLDSANAGSLMVVIAGLSRGKPVFFEWLDGEATKLPLPVPVPNIKAMTAPGAFVFKPIKEKFDISVEFDKDRILPLLGMGEPGEEESSAPGDQSFLAKLQNSLSNVIWVKDTRTKAEIDKRSAEVDLILGLKAAGVETEVTLKTILDLNNFDVKIEAGKLFPIVSRRIEEHALGLVWVVEQKDKDERLADKPVEMFQLGFAGGQTGFELNTTNARMELRFDGLSSDGKGVVFDVEVFKISAGGLDVKAKVRDTAVQMNGINVPFRFTAGSLEIRGGRLVSASIAGRGSLPPKLIGEADCTIALTFGEDANEGIVLQSGKVELDKKGDPIVCHASRFTLTITDLDIAFVKDNGYHFYYLVTGSLRFTPKSGEFESGLLQFLDGVEMNLERTPLSADPRVLIKHISFQKSLNPKKTFNLFNLFTFEIRGFGYHPASPKFGGDPAVNVSGQIKFVEIGDVMQPNIDFHGLWIAPPAKGQSLPRIRADGLGIELNLKGAIHVRGSVLAVDPGTTVEGTELAPPGYDTYGFLGEGELEIPGWGNLATSLGFLELERQDHPGERRKSFFFYAEKRQMSVEIPAVVWTFYLREVGFGFGFRYTLEALAAADRAPSIPKLISALDDISKRQGDLHKFSAWRPEVEGDHVTLALKGAIQAYPAEKSWNVEAEEAAQNPFLFDLVAAIRSDFTLFMGLRGWLGTNYIDYLNDKDKLRSNPGLRGYLYISAPHKRLLARAIGDSKGYIGDRIPALAKSGGSEPPLRRALRSIDWSVTLFIKPGLFHYEMGWPDQLVVRLIDEPNMRVTVRGGMIFRAADDGLLWGYNIEADAFFRFGGSLQIGPIGIAGEASLDAHLVARVICYLSWRIKGSLIYGLIALDAALAISIRAWLEVDLGFKTFTIRISFSRSLQLSASVEMVISTEGVGAQVHARVAISAFGCTLSVSIGFTLGGSQLAEARARVQRFMAMSITAEEPDAAPAVSSHTGDKRIESDAEFAEAPAMAPSPEQVVKPGLPGLPASQFRSQYGREMLQTDFWLIMHEAKKNIGGKQAPDGHAYALLVPREPAIDPIQEKTRAAFYAAPTEFDDVDPSARSETKAVYRLKFPPSWSAPSVKRWDSRHGEVGVDPAQPEISVRWNSQVPSEQATAPEEPSPKFTLAQMFDECFLSDTEWRPDPAPPYRITTKWLEPYPRKHGRADDPIGATEQERIAERDTAQRARLATALRNPVVEAVHQTRSTVLSMFLEQFVSLCETGPRNETYAHVTDLGLIFFGKVEDLKELAHLKIEKLEKGVPTDPGDITVFNARETWFDLQDPILASGRSTVAADGIKLDWRLQLAGSGTDDDPEQFLDHYEIRRTLEGQEFTPRIVKVKPAATIGGWDDNGKVTLLRPDWQFTDDLADISAELRAALLPVRDESLALQAAINWANLIGDDDSISVTYTVTPVDIAGTRGLPKSFLVDVRKPQPPIRPAEAELRFVVTRMGQDDGKPWTAQTAPKDSVGVVIALRDPFRERDPKDPKDSEKGFISPTIRVVRNYRLIADPESIRPSGHYGTDGLTDRRLGPPSGVGPTADELVWILNSRDKDVPNNNATHLFNEGKALFRDIRGRDGKIPNDTDVDSLEPDRDTIAKFPLWRRLAGKTLLEPVDDEKNVPLAAPLRRPKSEDGFDVRDPQGIGVETLFLDSLWRRENANQERIATRFSLETFHTVTDYADPKKPKHLAIFNSKRTPVAIEVRVEPLSREASNQDIGLMRPEAFEWPVHLDMPPHQPGQIRAESGFARFRVPPDDTTGALKDLIEGAKPALVRDAERRVLTQISFAASSGFDKNSSTGIDEIHRTAVAGYDVHELDLDDLARLDTSTVELTDNAKTWRQARRVARVERVSPEMARLMPDHNRDWQGWQAHYPSETWRLLNRGQGRSGQSQPIRAPWYSAAESTLHFAERTPRIRLMPTAPEGAITDLMRNGRPLSLQVRLVAGPNSRAERTLLSIAPTVDEALAECEWIWTPLTRSIAPDEFIFSPHVGHCEVRYEGGDHRFSPRSIREALLGFGWKASPAVADKFMADRNALDGLAVEICGKTIVHGTPIETGKCVEPLSLNTFRHPLLEEVVGELEYAATSNALYRRYVVTPQSVQPGDAKDLAGFLSATVAEKDPYGWAALQQLGLAVTLRLYDRDQDRFVPPGELLALIDPVMCETAKRYRDALGVEKAGQPFVEVLLKPGSDRVAGPFNAVLLNANVEDETAGLKLDDDGLAMAQLSLRPRPEKFWTYYLVEMGWTKANWPSAQIAAGHPLKDKTDGESGDPEIWKTISIAGYDLYFENKADQQTLEVRRSVDGRIVEVRPADPASEPASMQAISWPKARTLSSKLDPTLSLLFRVPEGATIDLGAMLKVRARIVITTAATAGGKPIATSEELCAFDKLKETILEKRKEFTPTPVEPTDFPAAPFTSVNGDVPVPVELDSPAARKGMVRSPFELFGEIKADVWSAKAAEEDPPANFEPGTPHWTSASVAAFESLWHNLRSALPDFVWPVKVSQGQFLKPTYNDYQQVMGAYLSWSQRFLDHGAVPVKAPVLPYALAAPIKAQPWHLAAGSDGMLTLTFLHADRWAHARAYAVRPTPRYQNLALGAGYYGDKQDSERLVTDGLVVADRFKKPIGYALAVSPRTERIEPPVILGSRLTARKDGDKKEIWELVVARHGEEALAFSNRSLFARLGTEGTALTFAREYRDRDWPDRLREAKGQDVWPDVELYPKRSVGPLGRPLGDNEINDATLGEVADIYPSLWKGADIWRIDELPPHYRVAALAVARAGLVVSNVVSAMQDEMPRRNLRGRDNLELLDHPAIVVKRDDADEKSTIRVEGLRLISHADVTVEGAWPWIATDPQEAKARKDVVWWPDPYVTYALLRHGAATAESAPGEKATLEEEDAVVHLVARPDGQADLGATAVPIVVRCRGPRFEPQTDKTKRPSGLPEVTTREMEKTFGTVKAGREFHLAFSLAPRADGLIQEQTARHVLKDGDGDIVRKAFNGKAKAFALLRAEWRLTLTLGFAALPDVAAVKKRFADARDVLITAANSLDASEDNVHLANALRGMAANLETEAHALSDAGPLPDLTRLSRDRGTMLALAETVNLPSIVTPLPLLLKIEPTGAEILAVYDLPTKEEAEAVLALDQHPFGKKGGTLWRLCRDRLFGAAEGFKIRAVDRRNAIDMPRSGPKAEAHKWQAIGEIDIDVTPPDWADFASEG